MKRFYLKHVAQPDVYAVEADDDGVILNVLDLTAEDTKGAICPHMLNDLPLAGRVDDVERVTILRFDNKLELYSPECGNVHHLMTELLDLEREHIAAVTDFAEADSVAKMKKKAADNAGAKVHSLLARLTDRKPLPLFDRA